MRQIQESSKRLASGLTKTAILATAFPVLLAFLARSWWVADIAANLRIQWLATALCGLAVMVSLNQPRWVFLSCLLIVGVTPAIWSGYAIPQTNDTVEPDLIVATFNVLSDNSRLADVVRQIEESDADVIAVLELTTALQQKIRDELLSTYPYFVERPMDEGNFGIGLYSKTELYAANTLRVAGERVDSIEAGIQVSSKVVQIIATHPVPPVGRVGFERRNQQLAELARHISGRQTADRDSAVIVVGDLNLTPWSPLFHDFCDSAAVRRVGGSVTPTWYARPVFPCGLVLDHILVSKNFECLDYDTFGDSGSDHRLVRAALKLSLGDRQ